MFQADMWDPAEPSLSGFDALVRQIGTRAAAFGRPVLLLEGDSHQFEVQQPYSAGSPLRLMHPDTPVGRHAIRLGARAAAGTVIREVDDDEPGNTGMIVCRAPVLR